MISSIIEILARILGLTDFLIRRRAARNDDPRNQLEKAKKENAAAIANGTGGERLDTELDRLHHPPN